MFDNPDEITVHGDELLITKSRQISGNEEIRDGDIFEMQTTISIIPLKDETDNERR